MIKRLNDVSGSLLVQHCAESMGGRNVTAVKGEHILHKLDAFDPLLLCSLFEWVLQQWDLNITYISSTCIGLYLFHVFPFYPTSTSTEVRLRSELQLSFEGCRGRYVTEIKPLLIDRDQVFPKPASQPASKQASQSVSLPANAELAHAFARTHTAELKIIEWWRRSGRQQRERKQRRPSERERGGSDCTIPCESRSEGKSIVLKHLVELDGFPHFIINLWEGGGDETRSPSCPPTHCMDECLLPANQPNKAVFMASFYGSDGVLDMICWGQITLLSASTSCYSSVLHLGPAMGI